MFHLQMRGEWKSQEQTPEQDRRGHSNSREKLALNCGLSNGSLAVLGTVLFLLCFLWVGWGGGTSLPPLGEMTALPK